MTSASKGVLFIILTLVMVFIVIMCVNMISKLKEKYAEEWKSKAGIYILIIIAAIGGMWFFASNIPLLK